MATKRTGRPRGRPPKAKNKSTIAKEAEARARIAESITKAGKTNNVYYAMDEMHKALSIAQGMAGLTQPVITKAPDGTLTIKGGDIKLFGEWFGKYTDLIELLAKYQVPQVKPIEAPTPPPDPQDLERRSRKRFGLRIFEGGRPPGPVVPLQVNGKATS